MNHAAGAVPILALIPARAGSKSIPHKNIQPLAGKPLLAWSIEHALASRHITRTIVSTDSPLYAEIARSFGAETPFLRPTVISGDQSTDLEAFTHALDWLREHEGYLPEIVVHLRPTHPIRRAEDIDAMIELLLNDPDADSARSVVLAPETPYKMWSLGSDGRLAPIVPSEIPEPYNLPRQVLPPVYLQNASIDVTRARTITALHSMTGRVIRGYVMEQSYDIDHVDQLRRAEETLLGEQVTAGAALTFCFDIDGVIATLAPKNRYEVAEARPEVVELINALYQQGHTIILFTARGAVSSIDWAETTRRQLEQWGVRYHELKFGKPFAHYYVDDRLLSISRLRRIAGLSKGT